MYRTGNNGADDFDWFSYYKNSELANKDHNREAAIYPKCREHLKDDIIRFTAAVDKMIGKLTCGVLPDYIRVLEIGAGTGFLTRVLLRRYAGTGTLVDISSEAYQKYMNINDPIKTRITYEQKDVFLYESLTKYDVVCSFGLIEHFHDKRRIMYAHQKFLKAGGFGIILVPMDTPLSRVYYEVHPELNQGYRELLTEQELKSIVEENGQSVMRIAKSRYLSYDVLAVLCA